MLVVRGEIGMNGPPIHWKASGVYRLNIAWPAETEILRTMGEVELKTCHLSDGVEISDGRMKRKKVPSGWHRRGGLHRGYRSARYSLASRNTASK